MELIVGQGFDHRAPHPTPPRLGSEAVGQEGLLQRLEFRAGLTPPRQSPHSRLRHIVFLFDIKTIRLFLGLNSAYILYL